MARDYLGQTEHVDRGVAPAARLSDSQLERRRCRSDGPEPEVSA